MGKAPGLVHPSLLQVSTKQGIISALKRREPGGDKSGWEGWYIIHVEVASVLIEIDVQVFLIYIKLIKRRIRKSATFIHSTSFPDAVPPPLSLPLSR
jgi:hypothetical protein